MWNILSIIQDFFPTYLMIHLEDSCLMHAGPNPEHLFILFLFPAWNTGIDVDQMQSWWGKLSKLWVQLASVFEMLPDRFSGSWLFLYSVTCCVLNLPGKILFYIFKNKHPKRPCFAVEVFARALRPAVQPELKNAAWERKQGKLWEHVRGRKHFRKKKIILRISNITKYTANQQNFTFCQKCPIFIVLYFPIFSSILCFSR